MSMGSTFIRHCQQPWPLCHFLPVASTRTSHETLHACAGESAIGRRCKIVDFVMFLAATRAFDGGGESSNVAAISCMSQPQSIVRSRRRAGSGTGKRPSVGIIQPSVLTWLPGWLHGFNAPAFPWSRPLFSFWLFSSFSSVYAFHAYHAPA